MFPKEVYDQAYEYALETMALANGFETTTTSAGKTKVTYSEAQCTAPSKYSQLAWDAQGNDIDTDVPYLEWSAETKTCRNGFGLYRKFCEIPTSRGTSGTSWKRTLSNIPAFAYDPQTQTCTVTKAYCDFFDVDFTNGDCRVNSLQQLFEFMLGTTLTRLLRRAIGFALEGMFAVIDGIGFIVQEGIVSIVKLFGGEKAAEDARKWIGNQRAAAIAFGKTLVYGSIDGIVIASDFVGDRVGEAVAGIESFGRGALKVLSNCVPAQEGATIVASSAKVVAGQFVQASNEVASVAKDVGNSIASAANSIGKAFSWSDVRMKTRFFRVQDNYFAPGVHLYFYAYKSEYESLVPAWLKHHDAYLGAMADELERVYPQMVEVDEATGFKRIPLGLEWSTWTDETAKSVYRRLKGMYQRSSLFAETLIDVVLRTNPLEDPDESPSLFVVEGLRRLLLKHGYSLSERVDTGEATATSI